MAVIFTCNKCMRRSCQLYEPGRRNHCQALVEVYEDDNKCPFYKKKEKTK